jgi:hypothetical protein
MFVQTKLCPCVFPDSLNKNLILFVVCFPRKRGGCRQTVESAVEEREGSIGLGPSAGGLHQEPQRGQRGLQQAIQFKGKTAG